MEFKVYKDASGLIGAVEDTTQNKTYKLLFVNDGCVRASDGSREKYIKVKDDYDWCVCVQKTQIKAKGGARGLLKHYADEIWQKYLQDLVEHALNNIKECSVRDSLPDWW